MATSPNTQRTAESRLEPADLALTDCDDIAMRLVLPSDGELHENTLTFMKACGLAVRRPNARRYTGSIPALPGVTVLFQRTGDIPMKVEEGSAELGITGLDRLLENRIDENLSLIHI